MDSLTDKDEKKRESALFKLQAKELDTAIRESSPDLQEVMLEEAEKMHKNGTFQAYFSRIGAVRRFVEFCKRSLS
jgi:hypothetical protein